MFLVIIFLSWFVLSLGIAKYGYLVYLEKHKDICPSYSKARDYAKATFWIWPFIVVMWVIYLPFLPFVYIYRKVIEG